ERDHHSYETISLGWVMSCAQFQDQLLLGAQINRLLMSPPPQIPKVEMPTVLAVEKQVRVQPVFDHVGSSPLACDHRIVAEMPPEIVSQILWPPVHLPLTEHIEGIVIKKEDSARSLTIE